MRCCQAQPQPGAVKHNPPLRCGQGQAQRLHRGLERVDMCFEASLNALKERESWVGHSLSICKRNARMMALESVHAGFERMCIDGSHLQNNARMMGLRREAAKPESQQALKLRSLTATKPLLRPLKRKAKQGRTPKPESPEP